MSKQLNIHTIDDEPSDDSSENKFDTLLNLTLKNILKPKKTINIAVSGNIVISELERRIIDTEHFQRWLELFKQTVDENFEGEKAREAKEKAESIAMIFQTKLGLIKDDLSIL